MIRLSLLSFGLLVLGCCAEEPEGNFAPNTVPPPEPIDDSEGRTSVMGQAMDAAENLEMEIGEYNDRIQQAVDDANSAAGGRGRED